MLQPPLAPDASPIGLPTDPIAPLRIALRGHYEIEREIGQGAFATVYLARDLKHERKVALKVLHADPTSETGELRFIREIRLLAGLQHPNILSLHDSGHVEALLYYVMPYVSGETLRDRIDRLRQLPADAACTIAREVADALAYAHGHGIIHRDIKPENILLSTGHPILADFGIARAIDLAGVRQLTQTGMGSPGTPAYMSPEQLMGDRELDGRSDTYSLGCVLYEMLTGKPPFSGKEGFVKRFTEPPLSVSTVRRDLPRWIDDVVAKALARSPRDRYQTAQEFVDALCPPDHAHLSAWSADSVRPRPTPDSDARLKHDGRAALSGGNVGGLAPLWPRAGKVADGARVDADSPRSRLFQQIRNHPRIASSVLIALLLATVAIGRGRFAEWRKLLGGTPAIDTARVAVLPFVGSASQRDRDRIANGFYGSLSEWRGLPLTGDQDVADAARADGAPTTTRAAAALARRVGAGRFIWGQVSADDPSQARIQLYDASSNISVKSVRLHETANKAAFSHAVQELLTVSDRPAAADGGDGRTTSYPAWRSYGQGHVAIHNGNLSGAESDFRAAANADPSFAPARVWLAQVLAWQAPEKRSDWRDQAFQGLRAGSGLSERDHLIALALSRLAERRYPESCAHYAELTKRDSLDFVGFYGLGQCRAFDSLVIRAPASWQFRSRYSDAANAYMRALTIEPAAHSFLTFEQLVELLPIAPAKTRRGSSSDGQEFAAFPALLHDTVVFVPYPLIEFARLPANQTAVARDAALEKNRTLLLDFATDWARQSPGNAGAFQALAEVLEARGEITRTRSGGLSALDAVRKARQVAVNARERQLAATKEAWLRFKQGDFVQARLLADSVLASASHPLPEDAAAVIGLAALTGKIGRTAELARQLNNYAASAASVPVQVMDAAAPFFAFAALGVCSDTTRVLERRLDDQLAHYVAEDEVIRVRVAVKARPLSMPAPCTAGKSSVGIDAAGDRLLNLQQAFATGDTRSLRTLLQRVVSDAKTQRPGDVSLDVTYQVAWLRSAMGDTAAAVRQLDRALGALPSLSASSLREAGSAAAAGRAMALRAELARAQGDVEEQKKWARALADLWATADPPLQPVVAKMRALAAPAYQK